MVNSINRRPPPYVPPINRQPWDIAKGPLWDFLRKMWDSYSGIPGGFKDIIALPVSTSGSAGLEIDGWASATHVHNASHTLLDAHLHTDTASGTPTLGSIIWGNGTDWAISGSTHVYDSVPTNGANSFLNVSGTLPTPTAAVAGMTLSFTGAGAAVVPVRAGSITLNAGATGDQLTSGLIIQNKSLGTGVNSLTGNANFGAEITTSGATTGENVGASLTASGSSLKNLGLNISSLAAGSTLNVGQRIVLGGTNTRTGLAIFDGDVAASQVYANALLLLDNISFSDPFLLGRVAGVTKVTLEVSGDITLGDTAGVASPASRAIKGEPGLGADKVGGNLTLHGGQSTGAGTPSKTIIQATSAGISSSTLQTLFDALTVDAGGTAVFASGLRVKGASLGAVTLDNTNHVIRVDASGAPVTLTLPALAAGNRGVWYRVKKIDASANNVTIARTGADTIDGAASVALGTQYDARDVVAPDTGTDWGLFSSFSTSGGGAGSDEGISAALMM